MFGQRSKQRTHRPGHRNPLLKHAQPALVLVLVNLPAGEAFGQESLATGAFGVAVGR